MKLKMMIQLSIILVLTTFWPPALSTLVPGYCEGELAGPRCNHIDAFGGCERLEGCSLQEGACVGEREDIWCQDYATQNDCELNKKAEFPVDSFCRCCGESSSKPNSCSWHFCDLLTGSEQDCREPDFPKCKWVHSCPGKEVTVNTETTSNDDCSNCLSACSGLPCCCTGTGCMCESDCYYGTFVPKYYVFMMYFFLLIAELIVFGFLNPSFDK